MRLHYKTPCITRVFLSKISSTVYANVSTDEADALRGERVEGRASNLSLLKEAQAQKRERRRLWCTFCDERYRTVCKMRPRPVRGASSCTARRANKRGRTYRSRRRRKRDELYTAFFSRGKDAFPLEA